MTFKEFKTQTQNTFNTMKAHRLFATDVTNVKMWETYLEAFTDTDEKQGHNCNCCKSYIRQYGNIVAIINGKVTSMWSCDAQGIYAPVAKAMAKLVEKAAIKNLFLTGDNEIGTDFNIKVYEDDTSVVWNHFYQNNLPSSCTVHDPSTIQTKLADYSASRSVFERGLNEITQDSLETVLELIDQKSLYRGDQYKRQLSLFLSLKKEYSKLGKKAKHNFTWLKSLEVGSAISRLRNTAIGTLLQDISNGVELDSAVTSFERMVAPSNYKRPKAIFTKAMIRQAEKKLEELGLTSSLGRRHATADDIHYNDVLYKHVSTKNAFNTTIFDQLEESIAVNPKKLSKVEEVSIGDFITNILPKVKKLELLLENKHESNLLSIIAPQDKESPSLFQWDNGFSWSYNGNLTDSSTKELVKKAGGDVTGVLRFSIRWNEKGSGDNNTDFDAHCIEPNGNKIYYSKPSNRNTLGNLDVDITNPNTNVAVENITFPKLNRMEEGQYEFIVNNYHSPSGQSSAGFSAEIEYGGEIYEFAYTNPLKNKEKVLVAKIKFSKSKGIEFIKSLPSNSLVNSKQMWSLDTNKFHEVNMMTLSPNYWGDNKTGNKHYFFMLKGLVNPDSPRGFYNEFLRNDLITSKRMFEGLGAKLKVQDSPNQLNAVGFSSTQRKEVIVKVTSKFERLLKIKF